MTLKQACKLGAVILMGVVVHPAFAVYELVEIQLPASKLAGTVLDPSGASLSGVDVTVHRCTFRADGGLDMHEKVLGKVKTNALGHFALPLGLRPTAACLSFRSNGFNPLLVGIKWRKSASLLEITMPIGG
jgi:hypothetical protein